MDPVVKPRNDSGVIAQAFRSTQAIDKAQHRNPIPLGKKGCQF
jgi:hypothetical protein